MPCPSWKPAYDVTIIVDGDTLPAIDATYSEQLSDDPVTNTESNGDHEFVTSETVRNMRFTIPVASTSSIIPTLTTGAAVTASFSDGVNTYSGCFNILSRDLQGGGRGAYRIACSGKFNGAVTTS